MTKYNVMFTMANVTNEIDNPLEYHKYIKVNVYGMENGTTDRLCLIRSITTAIDLDSCAPFCDMVTTCAHRAKLFTAKLFTAKLFNNMWPQRNRFFSPAERKAVERAYELLPLIKGDVTAWGMAYSHEHEGILKTLHEADYLNA